MFKTSRRKLMFLAAGLASSMILGMPQANAGSNALNGAGATFPYPVYIDWARAYYKATGQKINYQGIGSGGGQRQITARVVDFAGSDEMLSPVELEKRKLYQFPGVTGAIVVVYNLPGIGDGKIKLSNRVVSDIFMGKIKYWNNPLIKEENPNVRLPHKRITVVHRSEGSGTTWNFTYWLSHISPAWMEKIGFGKVVNWPTGIGAKGNAGVSAYIRRIPGSIGYVEYAYKLQNHLKVAQLQSTAGNFIKPSKESFQAAAAHASLYWESHFYNRGNILLAPGKESWPITVTTMILLPREKTATNKKVTEFYNWAYKHGGEIATKLGYVPLPKSLVKDIRTYWQKVVFSK